VVDRFEFVEKKEGGQRQLPVDDTRAPATTEEAPAPTADDKPPPEFDDDIPF
jgi:hypothetical protein